MEVKLLEKTLIFPSHPPFDHDHILPLSHIDNDRNVQVNFRYLRAYVSSDHHNHDADPVHVISESLSKALVHYYPFAGTLRRRSNDARLELFCAVGQGVPVIRATANRTLDSVNYLDDPGEHFLEELVPDPTPEDALLHPFVLQITVFTCGGFSLGSSIHHSMCDGLGSTQFFNAMAEFARGASHISIEPVWDRASLLGPRDPPRVEFPFHEFLCLDKEFSPYCKRTSTGSIRECFHVRDESLERFKAFLYEQSGRNFTTFEALGAFIWRARVKASKVPDDEKVKFAYSINIRNQLKPTLPVGYWGNGCVAMYVQLNAQVLVEQPIWETAELIKKSKRNATDEYVRSFIDFQELYYAEGITAGKGVSGFTDWRHLGHSTVDFGWGGPVTVLPLSRNLLGSVEPCFFLPYSSAINEGNKDGFKVLVALPETAMADFRVEMEKLFSIESNGLERKNSKENWRPVTLSSFLSAISLLPSRFLSSSSSSSSTPKPSPLISSISSTTGQIYGRKFSIGSPVKKGRSQFHFSVSNVATDISPPTQAQKLAKESQRPVYPFAAIVGQDEMKLCLLLNVIDPKIGGVMIMGDRGTGKSTTVRSLVDLLPEIKVVAGDPFNSDPEDPESMGVEVRESILKGDELSIVTTKINMVDLPLGATEDRVCGTIDIEKALTEGVKAFEPGLLAKANRGILYVDEVNLLDDHLVDVLLDSAASGWNTVEREGISISHPARFILIGSGNPEEGELRPQLLDRFGMHAQVGTVRDAELRVKIVEERARFDQNPKEFRKSYKADQEKLQEQITSARSSLSSVQLDHELRVKISKVCAELNVDGLRGDIVTNRAAKALAALKGRDKVTPEDIATVIPNCLRHRLRKDPLESIDSGLLVIEKFYEVFS
ncbi:Magnesium chelatase [Macleaya cordata]|uniref:Mg-protoporphyrin IX chelatase n=1 Tax=Macleaya cordata TaxID=56857 RepID=A0A200Q1B3_MACCD|nr:Magnesium chelatase [Macleaya cordata]